LGGPSDIASAIKGSAIREQLHCLRRRQSTIVLASVKANTRAPADGRP
jgi:hypothetical protein